MKSPLALLRSLLDDLRRLHPGVEGLDRDFITIKQRVEHEGYAFLSVALPALDDALLLGLTEKRFTCPRGFKKIRGGAIPEFFQGMLSEVFDSKTGTLLEGSERTHLRDIHMFLRFAKKVQLSSENEALLHSKTVTEFYQCDGTAKSVQIPDRQDHLIGLVGRSLLLPLHRKDKQDERIYRHGPGAVQEGCNANQKWSLLHLQLEEAETPDWFGDTISSYGIRSDGRLLVLSSTTQPTFHDQALKSLVRDEGDVRGSAPLPEGRPPATFGATLPGPQGSGLLPSGTGKAPDAPYLHGRGRRGGPSRSSEQLGLAPYRPRGASAKLITVAKNSSSRRTITIEPLLRQFLQQGLNTMLRETISECSVLRNCLALTDQSLNQKLALEGSRSGDWATIDLKSASDLLSVTLVKSVFRHHPEFLGMMMDARSPFVYTSGSKDPAVALGKFAGMGNATTFPVQSICFAVVCIAAIFDSWGLKPTQGRLKRASRLVRVYGDDIVVHKDYAHQVVGWLHDVGLKVNVKKSFLEGNFRESCGVDAYNGVEITPLYLRHWPHQIGESPSVCAHLVSLSNHMWLQGLYSGSNYLRGVVEEYLGSTLPLVSSQSGSLGWHTRQDAMEPHKWCRNTHQFLTRTFALKPEKSRDELDGYPALLKCLLTPLLGRDKDHLKRTVKRFKNRLIRRWVPTHTWAGLNLQT